MEIFNIHNIQGLVNNYDEEGGGGVATKWEGGKWGFTSTKKGEGFSYANRRGGGAQQVLR